MKILHVDINGWIYGVQKYVINFCTALNRINGYRSIVVGPSGDYLNALREENIEAIPFQEHWEKIDTAPRDWVKLLEIIKGVNPDIVHSHGTKENIVSKISGFLLGIPVIPVYHCNYKQIGSNNVEIGFKRMMYETIYLDILERLTSSIVPKNIAVSGSVRDNIRRFGIPVGRIDVIYSGVNIDDFELKRVNLRRRRNKIRIVSISRIDEGKGIRDIIEAAKGIEEKEINFEFNLVGDGHLVANYQRLVNSYNLGGKVKFLGYMKNIREVLLASDIFVSASYSEGFPLTIVEAMACGLPVVVTDAGGVTEIVDDKVNGLVVEKGNRQQLKESLLLMMKNSTVRWEYGRKGREKVVANFSMDRMIAQYISVYETILERTVS
ncbi:MAG: glycosyltransferase family 4 protein [Candidatus Hodarchaeota archaeon]